MSFSYVAFEGPIGVGKTTLAHKLGAVTGWDLLLEDFQANEFLADFYRERDRWALPMQLSFLAARHAQLGSAACDVRSVIADHTYAKDAMFARLLLQEREWRLYESVRASLAKVPQPHVIAYLDAPTEVLLERIGKRGRPYESTIDAAYLNDLRAAYERDFITRSDVTIVRVDTSSFDVDDTKALEDVFRRIRAPLSDE